MIIGAHSIIYSANPEADRAFFRDVLKFPYVDVGDGWLVFGLPPAEVAFHPSDTNNLHEFYLMCDDVESLIAEMRQHNILCGEIQNQGWGLLAHLTLPGGGRLGIYEPRHARPKAISSKAKSKKSVRRTPKAAAGIVKKRKLTRKTRGR
jgi:hypothetical protein